MTHSDLYAELKRHVPEEAIKSVKVAFDPEDYECREYAFASFATKEAAQQYIERSNKALEPLKPLVEARDKARAKFDQVFAQLEELIKKKDEQDTVEATRQLDQQ